MKEKESPAVSPGRHRRCGASESILQGLSGLLGLRQQRGRGRDSRLEQTRAAMIDALGGRAPEVLARRLRYALDIESLWHLRTDVHLALCRLETEREARERLDAITALFVGAVPAALSRRFGTMCGPAAGIAAPAGRSPCAIPDSHPDR